MPYTLHLPFSFSYFLPHRDAPSLSDCIDLCVPATACVRPKCPVCLPQKYSDYVDSDTVVQQLLGLCDDELSLPVDNNLSFYSVICSVASTDALLCSIQDNNTTDPPNLSEAKKSKYWTEWLSAIHEELESLKSKGVYKEVDTLPPGRKAVQCKWVLHIKRDKDGTISRFKARLVAKGFTQIPGLKTSPALSPLSHGGTPFGLYFALQPRTAIVCANST
jgi:hypothetical protein